MKFNKKPKPPEGFSSTKEFVDFIESIDEDSYYGIDTEDKEIEKCQQNNKE